MFIFQLFTFILIILGLVVPTGRVVVSRGVQVLRVYVEGLEGGPDAGAKPVARHHDGGHQSASLWGKPGLGIGMWNVLVKDQCLHWSANLGFPPKNSSVFFWTKFPTIHKLCNRR